MTGVSPLRIVRLAAAAAALTVVLTAMAAGCSQRVAGQATDAAGFSPQEVTSGSSTGSTTPSQSSSTTEPAAKRLAGVDLCGLMTPADLEPLGGAATDASRDSVLPDSCSYKLAGGAPDDLAVIARYKPIEQVREQQPDGRAERAAGYPAWIACEADNGYNSCTAAVAVGQDRTLLTGLSLRDISTTTVVSRLETLTVAAIDRLPDAD